MKRRLSDEKTEVIYCRAFTRQRLPHLSTVLSLSLTLTFELWSVWPLECLWSLFMVSRTHLDGLYFWREIISNKLCGPSREESTMVYHNTPWCKRYVLWWVLNTGTLFQLNPIINDYMSCVYILTFILDFTPGDILHYAKCIEPITKWRHRYILFSISLTQKRLGYKI